MIKKPAATPTPDGLTQSGPEPRTDLSRRECIRSLSSPRRARGPAELIRDVTSAKAKGGDLAAPGVHRQPRGHRHKDGAPVRLCLSRDWPFSALPGMPEHEADLVCAQPGQAARSRHRCAPRPAATPVQHIESTAGIRRFRSGITLSSERVQRERARSRRSSAEYGRRGTPVMSRRTDGPEICLSHDLLEVLLL